MKRIGIDVGGTTVKLGIVENNTQITARDTRDAPHDPEKMVLLLKDMIEKWQKIIPDAPVGISIAGAFNSEGTYDANQLGFVHVPLDRMLNEAVGWKVPIENDGICAMVAEWTGGSLKGCNTAVMITLGTGIGGGVIIGGKPYVGYHGVHAELGHMITHADGLDCSCGQKGCWECYASASALSRMSGGMKPREILERVENGEMKELWNQYLWELKQGIIGLCSIFYPEKIAIGGGLSNAGAVLMDGLRELLHQDLGYQRYFSFVQIEPASFHNDAGILGAAALAKSKTEV